MSFRIRQNLEALTARRQLASTSLKVAKAIEKLASGSRLTGAADDAAGLAISEKMRSQIGGMAQAQNNALDGVSALQTAESALGEVHSILGRIRDLKVRHENGALATSDRDAIATEAKQLGVEMRRIVEETEFNEIKLLDASAASARGRGAKKSGRNRRPRPRRASQDFEDREADVASRRPR